MSARAAFRQEVSTCRQVRGIKKNSREGRATDYQDGVDDSRFPITSHSPPVNFADDLVIFPHTGSTRIGLRPLLPGIMALASLTTTTSCSKITREAQAIVLAAEGSVMLEGKTQGSPPQTLALRSSVRKGETIRTGPAGSAALLLLPGALLQIDASSAVTIGEIKISKNGNAYQDAMHRVIRLSLTEGTIHALTQFEPGSARWSVETPHGVLATDQPSLCRLELRGERMRIVCLRGSYTIAPAGGKAPSSIDAGYYRDFPPADTAPSPVEGEAQSQDQVDHSLDVEQKLLEMQRAERFSPFPWRNL